VFTCNRKAMMRKEQLITFYQSHHYLKTHTVLGCNAINKIAIGFQEHLSCTGECVCQHHSSEGMVTILRAM
jgi:hypothetical protein